MYLGQITVIRARQHHLSCLTEWNAPTHMFEAVYGHGRHRVIERVRWDLWCDAEARRIGQDPRRTAAIVKVRENIAVYVDWISGDPHDLPDDDEEEA